MTVEQPGPWSLTYSCMHTAAHNSRYSPYRIGARSTAVKLTGHLCLPLLLGWMAASDAQLVLAQGAERRNDAPVVGSSLASPPARATQAPAGDVAGDSGQAFNDEADQEIYRSLAKVIFRVLAFDRHLDQRCEFGAVRVVIVRGESERTRREASNLARALEESRGTTIAGLPYEYQVTDAAPKHEGYEIIFLPSGLPPELVREALQDSRQRGILCLTTDLSYIRSGAAVAIVFGADRPEIVIQKERAMEQGAEFDPRLYAYSTVICD